MRTVCAAAAIITTMTMMTTRMSTSIITTTTMSTMMMTTAAAVTTTIMTMMMTSTSMQLITMTMTSMTTTTRSTSIITTMTATAAAAIIHHHDHHADEVFTSWGVETARKFTKAEVEHALTELDTGNYGMILRSKGIVDGGADGWLEFDYVPGEWEVRSPQRRRGRQAGGHRLQAEREGHRPAVRLLTPSVNA